ncbi:MAG: T9SS type A sorting domain-containing protein [Ignavibacteriae bacterium]|nr:T9SS type A sorting domain-containing protein [Ignavibacteriota bacterium]
MNELKIHRIIIIILLATLVLINKSNANLVIELDNVVEGNNTLKVDASKYPLLHVRLKAKQDDIPISIQTSNILIVQNHKTTKPGKVVQFGNDWYDIYWNSIVEGGISIICVNGNESARIAAPADLNLLPTLNIKSISDDNNPDFYFGDVSPGNSSTITLNVIAQVGEHDSSGKELNLWLDSVRTFSDIFTTEWLGSFINTKPPPVSLIPIFRYRVNLIYKPVTGNYVRDKFKVFYENGLSEQVNLIGGKFDIPKANYLQLIQPNGGEKLTPCEIYTVKWRRYTPGVPTLIELSTDEGKTWTSIGQSNDSTFEWSVPSISTDNAKLRVRQELTFTKPKLLTKDAIPTYKITHNFNGYKLLDANIAGMVREWDLRDFSEKGVYEIEDISYPSEKILPLGIDYTDSDKKFAIAYRYTNQSQDYVAFFDTGNFVPVNKVQIEPGFNTKSMQIDRNKNLMAFVSQFSNRILIYSAKDGSFIKEIDFQFPVTAFTFNLEKDIAAVALFNGEVQLISTVDYSVINKFDFSDIPIILELGLSPDGKFIALAGMAPRNTKFISNNNEVHIFDISSQQIVRTIRNSSSDPVGVEFNPLSTSLLIGSSSQPQLTLWNLTDDVSNSKMEGSLGNLTDISFSPAGASIATSSNSSEHLWIRNFISPEEDGSDNNFSIIQPALQENTLTTRDEYIATSSDYSFNSSICNVGIVAINIDSVYLKNGNNFRLKNKFSPNVLKPGECINLDMVFSPRDTGKLYDSVIFTSCYGNYYARIEGYGKNRNILFYFDTLNFGEVCLDYKVDIDSLIVRNNDPIPLVINAIKIMDYPTAFTIGTSIINDTIPAGGSVKIKMSFSPVKIGETTASIELFHSYIPKFTIKKAVLKGYGIGTIYSLSHTDLRFIPEIPDRQIKVTNLSDNQIYLQKADIIPDGTFTISNPFPINIPAKGEINLDVHWNGENTSDVKLNVEAGPCISVKENTLGMYNGSSLLSFPSVTADPRGEADIPINFVNSENKPYKGIRPFEAEFTVNPRMFLPQIVTSDYGNAELIRNEIINDRRIIGIRVNGDYADLKGIVAKVHGIAGIAETDTSKIEFINTSTFWGNAVNEIYTNGNYKLINLYGRRFLQSSNIRFSISPNPASDNIDINIESDENTKVEINLFDELGNKIVKLFSGDLIKGISQVELNLPKIGNGSYYLNIKSDDTQLIQQLMIVR